MIGVRGHSVRRTEGSVHKTYYNLSDFKVRKKVFVLALFFQKLFPFFTLPFLQLLNESKMIVGLFCPKRRAR